MPLWLAFPRMMENIVLPGAKRDSMTYLREMLANDRQLRQVIYMYRRQVKSLFRRIAGPQKRSAESGRRGSLLDVTPKDHITLRTFAQLIKESGAAMPSLCPWDGHALTLPWDLGVPSLFPSSGRSPVRIAAGSGDVDSSDVRAPPRPRAMTTGSRHDVCALAHPLRTCVRACVRCLTH